MDTSYILAIDLGGTKLASALFAGGEKIVDETFIQLNGREGRQVGALILKIIRDQVEKSKSLGMKISSVGIAVPGIYNPDNGEVWAPNIKGWEDYPLYSELSDYLKPQDIRITIDSDRACYILGEYWKGVAVGCRHAIYLAVGTGIGAGILIDGKVLRGSHDIAGAIGWMSLRTKYLTPYATYGCFEYLASGQGIALQGQGMYSSSNNVFAAYERGEERAVSIVEEAILSWGQATANLVSLFNPEMIIFGGGVFGPASQYLNRIYEEACRWAQPISIRQVKFVSSELGEKVALYGAAYLAMFNE